MTVNPTRQKRTPKGLYLKAEVNAWQESDPLAWYLAVQKKYGDVVRIRGKLPCYLIFHPNGVRHVLQDNGSNYRKNIAFNGSLGPLLGKGLLTSEGTVWEKQRRIVQ